MNVAAVTPAPVSLNAYTALACAVAIISLDPVASGFFTSPTRANWFPLTKSGLDSSFSIRE